MCLHDCPISRDGRRVESEVPRRAVMFECGPRVFVAMLAAQMRYVWEIGIVFHPNGISVITFVGQCSPPVTTRERSILMRTSRLDPASMKAPCTSQPYGRIFSLIRKVWIDATLLGNRGRRLPSLV